LSRDDMPYDQTSQNGSFILHDMTLTLPNDKQSSNWFSWTNPSRDFKVSYVELCCGGHPIQGSSSFSKVRNADGSVSCKVNMSRNGNGTAGQLWLPITKYSILQLRVYYQGPEVQMSMTAHIQMPFVNSFTVEQSRFSIRDWVYPGVGRELQVTDGMMGLRYTHA